MNYIKEVKTPFNIEFGAREGGKTIFLLDKVFGNPRVYLQGVPPSGDLNEYYTKPEMDDILSSNYWTKFEVAQAIAEIQTMDIEVLSELPPIEEAQEYTIYLVPAPSSEIGNFYDEYLVINQQFELVGSTAVDMSQYAMKSDLEGYLPLSGGSISGSVDFPGRFVFPNDGYIWRCNNTFNTFYGTTTQTLISNQYLDLTCAGNNPLVRIDIPENGHLQYNRHNENSPGGFVIQDLSGKISAPYIEASSGIIQNDVNYELSSFVQRSLSGIDGDYISWNRTISGNERNFITIGSSQILIGDGRAGYASTPIACLGQYIQIRGYTTYLGMYNTSHIYHGTDSIENTPNGFSILDPSGNVTASGFIENGIEYHLSELQEKQDQIISDQETITLSSNVYIKANEPLSALTLTIPSGLTNSTIFFKTGDTFTSTINTSENAYVNEDFDFGPSGAYILSVEDDVILWSELTKRS